MELKMRPNQKYKIMALVIFTLYFIVSFHQFKLRTYITRKTEAYRTHAQIKITSKDYISEMNFKRWNNYTLRKNVPSSDALFGVKCRPYVEESKRQYSVQWFVRNCDYEEKDLDVTLLLHTDKSRLNVILTHSLKHWAGPVSIAIYSRPDEVTSVLQSMEAGVHRRNNIGVHIVERRDEEFYPVNHLRNLAFAGSTTSHVIMLDADFVPSPGSYEDLLAGIILNSTSTREKSVFVVPAFQYTDEIENFTKPEDLVYPSDKGTVVNMFGGNYIERFSQSRCRLCHYASNYKAWITGIMKYQIDYTFHYEPYVVVERNAMPLYDERLVSRHMNKVIFTLELYAKGFQFWVVPDAFLLHLPHPRSYTDKRTGNCNENIGVFIKSIIKSDHGIKRSLPYEYTRNQDPAIASM
ncbi:unnamed protein product [Owenia fusiformis]|uniref:Uncharacterized protein n=1 Tax=Owenia fusiformis TaxID=6347 RepID=A0A8J1XSA6_OWEFU|nr:unnamed protein product [Owenia fusiformis]